MNGDPKYKASITGSDSRVTALQASNAELIDACEHMIRVIQSMADRGRYPLELLPTDDYGAENALFLGRQGYSFMQDAVKRARALQDR